ncbi:hypothetical protein FGO68_gene12775 [Halteria grandinella]|uniref:Transmembrane protein n=1 Tax=Halteria grandinella TaxID=5974 RepID=A0A8J8NP61_HALGN|nr:hypothetical protein FGO68_gene12775 [Halteria grandinella]
MAFYMLLIQADNYADMIITDEESQRTSSLKRSFGNFIQFIATVLYLLFTIQYYKRWQKAERIEKQYSLTLIYNNGIEQPANFLSQEYQQFCYFTFLKLVQNVIELAFPFVLNNSTETLVERDLRRSQNQDEKLSFKLQRYIQRFYYALRILKPLVGIAILLSFNENIWPDFSFQLPIDHRHSIITDKKDQIYADAYLAYVKLYANTGIEAAYLLLEQFDQLWDFCAEIESNSSNLNYYKTKGGAICNFLLSSFEFYFFFTYAIKEDTSNAEEDISFQDFIFISMFLGGLSNLCQAYTLSQEVEGGRSLIQEDHYFSIN